MVIPALSWIPASRNRPPSSPRRLHTDRVAMGKPGTLSAPIWRHHGELVSRGNSVRHRDHGDVDGLRPGPGLRRAHQPGRDLRHGASRTSAPPVSSRPRTGASKTRLASQSTVYARYATRSKTGLGRCWSRSPASRTLHDTISLRAPAAPSPIWNPQPTLCSYYDMGSCSVLMGLLPLLSLDGRGLR